ncbi:Receptor-like cytosolic serine/threonine-protein kinase RBK2 [Linum perenne]
MFVFQLPIFGNTGSREPAKEAVQDKGTLPATGRRSRAGFSDSLNDLDLGSLVADEHEEDKAQSQAEPKSQPEPESSSSSASGALEDRSIVSLEANALLPTGSPAAIVDGTQLASTSGADSLSVVPLIWKDFFKAFKKGPAPLIRKQNIPSLIRAVPRLTRRKSKRIRDGMVPTLSSPLDAELCYLKPSWKNFALWEILAATDNFSRDKLIGEGGYAEVYKGQLSDGQFVAIKRLVRGSSPEEMTMDFLSELGIICHVDHPNIAKLIGYGVEGGMHLVLQLSINGSVSSLLYGPREKLSWPVRYKIAYGTAVGLLYLHEGCQRRIIHKDIKAANILLTEDFDPQIADFGLARWLPENWTHHTVSKIEGTFGYLPPEFFMHGIVDEKTDVYAYGVLLLELITGRQALDSSQQSLVMWAKPLLIKNKISDLVDPVLGQSYNLEQMERLVCLAAMCVEQASVQRPQMSQAVEILMGDESTLEEVKRRQKSKLQRTYSEELFDADEYNSTRYLCDLNIHLDDLLEPDDDLENFEECHSATKSPPPGEEETNAAAKNNGDAEKSKKDEEGLKNDGESKKDDEEGKSKDEGKPKEAEEKKRSKDEGKQKEAEEKKRSKDEGKQKEAEEKKRLKDEGKQKEAEEKKRLKDEVKQKEAEEKKRLKDEGKQKEAEEKKRLKDEGKQKEAEEKKRLKDEGKQKEAEEKKRLKDEGKQKEAEEKKRLKDEVKPSEAEEKK